MAEHGAEHGMHGATYQYKLRRAAAFAWLTEWMLRSSIATSLVRAHISNPDAIDLNQVCDHDSYDETHMKLVSENTKPTTARALGATAQQLTLGVFKPSPARSQQACTINCLEP